MSGENERFKALETPILKCMIDFFNAFFSFVVFSFGSALLIWRKCIELQLVSRRYLTKSNIEYLYTGYSLQ